MTQLLEELAIVLNLDAEDMFQDLSRAGEDLNKLQRRTQQVGRRMQTVGRRMTTFVTAPILALGTASVVSFARFDEAMHNVNVIARENEIQFQRTSKAVQDLAVELGKGPRELADALYNINSASFVAEEGLVLLEASAKAAIAGLATTAEAARTITAVLNAYGMESSEAADVSDILFKTIEKGVVTFPELASTLGNVISTAAAAGVEFEEVAAAVATMTKGGVGAAESVTSLNRFILKLITGTEELNEVFLQTAEGSAALFLEVNGLGKTVEFLAQETGGSTRELTKLGFTLRDLKAATSLTRREGRAFAEDLRAIEERAGATAAALVEQRKAFSFQFKQLKAETQVLLQTLGQDLAPVVSDLVDLLREGTDAFSELSEGERRVVIFATAAVAAIGPLVILLGSVVAAIGALAVAAPVLAGAALVIGGIPVGMDIGQRLGLIADVDEVEESSRRLEQQSQIIKGLSDRLAAVRKERVGLLIERDLDPMRSLERAVELERTRAAEARINLEYQRQINQQAMEMGMLPVFSPEQINETTRALGESINRWAQLKANLAAARQEQEKMAEEEDRVERLARVTELLNETLQDGRRAVEAWGNSYAEQTFQIKDDLQETLEELKKLRTEQLAGVKDVDLRREITAQFKAAEEAASEIADMRLTKLDEERRMEIAMFAATEKEKQVLALETERKRLLAFARTAEERAAIEKSFQRQLTELDERRRQARTRERLGIIEFGTREALLAERGVDEESRRVQRENATDNRQSREILEDIREQNADKINVVSF